MPLHLTPRRPFRSRSLTPRRPCWSKMPPRHPPLCHPLSLSRILMSYPASRPPLRSRRRRRKASSPKGATRGRPSTGSSTSTPPATISPWSRCGNSESSTRRATRPSSKVRWINTTKPATPTSPAWRRPPPPAATSSAALVPSPKPRPQLPVSSREPCRPEPPSSLAPPSPPRLSPPDLEP